MKVSRLLVGRARTVSHGCRPCYRWWSWLCPNTDGCCNDSQLGACVNSTHISQIMMDIAQWLPGVLQAVVVTIPQFEISSGVCSGFRPQKGPLLRFWKMDPLLPGVMQRMAVTVGCAADSGHRKGLCCDSGRWIRCYLHWCSVWQWQLGVQRIQATDRAFAAILEDGSVVTCIDAAYGSDSSAVRL